MNEKEFNLIDQPWIKVRTPSLKVETVSLRDALLRAHEYVDLAGELPTQDAAVLRLLLAVLHTVFSRVDAQGRPDPLKTARQGLKRWKELWEGKQLPEKPLDDYFSQWHERFWLFHPERPFYQVNEAEKGTEYSAAKLNGELSESANKLRLFPARGEDRKETLSYEEAARWLLYVNGYDDTSAKPKTKGLPSVGAGWLGKLGFVSALGHNLFETLMLNFVLLKEKTSLWSISVPTWEWDVPRGAERTQIPLPCGQAELLTLQSRRILLKRAGDAVIGYSLLGGDFFLPENAFTEQMTLWRSFEDRQSSGFRPQRHSAAKQIWREFSTMSSTEKNGIRPGVVTWVSTLKTANCLDTRQWVSFKTAAVQYGDKDFFAADVFGDQITFHVDLITELGTVWQRMIEKEVSRTEELASAVGMLAGDLEKAVGHVEKDKKGDVIPSWSMGIYKKVQELFYHRIDVPFRLWLQKLDPSQGDAVRIELQREWIETARRTVLDLGQELVRRGGDAALLGRNIEEAKKRVHYSAPEVYKRFQFKVGKTCKGGER